MLRITPEDGARQEFALTLDEICRTGAERMLAFALEAEVDAYLERHQGDRDEQGHALVVRNGRARPRSVTTPAGAIDVLAPRVDDRRVDPASGERSRFRSVVLPPYARRSAKVAEVLPLLYLHGLSTSEFVPALAEFFGTQAGLSAAAIPGSPRAGRPSTKRSEHGTCRGWTTSTSGSTGSTSTCAWGQTIACACWSWWVFAPTGPTSSWGSATATGNRPSPGPSCCGIAVAGACGPRYWPSVTERWAFGRRCATCSPRPRINATGCTRRRTS